MPELAKKSQETTKRAPEPPQKPAEPTKKPQSTSPTRQRRFALEMWVQVQVGPNTYDAPDEDTISADFLIDVLNLVYPGVTCSNSLPLYPDTGPFLPVQNYPTLEP